MSTPRKKTVTLRLTSREKQDAKAILDALRDALKPENISLRVIAEKEASKPTEILRPVALEHLEAAALNFTAKHLDEKAKEIQQRGHQALSPGAIARLRKTLSGWGYGLAKAGWKILVFVKEVATWTGG